MEGEERAWEEEIQKLLAIVMVELDIINFILLINKERKTTIIDG